MKAFATRFALACCLMIPQLSLLPIATRAQDWIPSIQDKIRNERALLAELNREHSRLSTLIRDERQRERTFFFAYKEQELEYADLERRVKRIDLDRARIQEDIALAAEKPDLVGREKQSELLDRNRLLSNQFRDASSRRDEQAIRVGTTRQSLEAQKRAVEQLESEKTQLEVLIDSLSSKQTTIVTTTGTCIITEDISPKDCREQAIRAAEQSAVEHGAQQIVESVSSVVNLELVRDEVKSSAKARIINKNLEVTLDASVGQFGQYTANIVAAVQSIPPPSRGAVSLERGRLSDPTTARISGAEPQDVSYQLTEEERDTAQRFLGAALIGSGLYWAFNVAKWMELDGPVNNGTATLQQINDYEAAASNATLGAALTLVFGVAHYSLSENASGTATLGLGIEGRQFVGIASLNDAPALLWGMRW